MRWDAYEPATAMKLLHVSDWHLGRMTYLESRARDHDAVLAEMAAYAREHRPDLIIHTGDLFDMVRPAYTDMTRGITALQELAVVAPTVVLCGNHDSPALFDLLAQLTGDDSPIRFVSRARPPEKGGILRFEAGDGSVVRLAPLPFVHANRMLDGFEDPLTWASLYADRIHRVEAWLGRGLLDGFDNRRDVCFFAAHLHVGGAILSGSERRVHVGEDYASHLEHIPAVTYAAFGHIHKPQDLPGTILPGAYAGSPIQLDFGELGEQKRVVLVEARPGYPPEVVSLPLSAGRPLWRFDGTLEGLRECASGIGDVLGLLTIHTPAASPRLQQQVADLLPLATLLQVNEVPGDARLSVPAEVSSGGDVEPSIDDLFRDYLRDHGTRGIAAERVLTTYRLLMEAVEAEQSVRFPEEEGLGHHGVEMPPAVEEAAVNEVAVPAAGTGRICVCSRCGSSFKAPVQRGRPPSLCPSCRLT